VCQDDDEDFPNFVASVAWISSEKIGVGRWVLEDSQLLKGQRCNGDVMMQ